MHKLFAESKAKQLRPMTLLVVVFDSVSRAHFYRNFNETAKWLKTKLPDEFAVYDFINNNAHGTNSEPNIVALLMGYNITVHKDRI
jgi:hypothetical protein